MIYHLFSQLPLIPYQVPTGVPESIPEVTVGEARMCHGNQSINHTIGSTECLQSA